MNSIKCINCGVINWVGVEKCVRCWSDPAVVSQSQTDETVSRADTANAVLESNAVMTINPLFLGAAGLVVLICVCVLIFKGLTTASPDSSMTAVAIGEIALNAIHPNSDKGSATIAVPPPDLGVAEPSLESIMSYAKDELIRDLSNGEFTQTSDFTSTPLTKQDDEVYQKTVGDCWQWRAGTSGCESARQGVQADINAREHNRMIDSIRRTECRGRIGGPVTLREAGHYHRIDDKIYFSVKVYAPGEEGAIADGKCVYKPAIAGLTTNVVVKIRTKETVAQLAAFKQGRIRKRKLLLK